MVIILDDIQRMIQKEGIIVVGSVDINGVCNVSPRSSFHCTNDAIYWLDFFSHKSRQNFSDVPWISIAVFDKEQLRGFQLKGKISIVKDPSEKRRLTYLIMRSKPALMSKIHSETTVGDDLEVMMFKPKAIYSLNPQEESGTALVIDNDGETVSLLGI